jgi:hypothetical protein
MRLLKQLLRPVVILEIVTTVTTLLLGFSVSAWLVFILLPPLSPWSTYGALLFFGLVVSYYSVSVTERVFVRLGEWLGIL